MKTGIVETTYCYTDKLKDTETFERYYQMLSQERKNKVDQFKMDEDKRQSVCAGILLNDMLTRHGIKEHAMVTAYKENGKPYFPQYPELQFNLSHSHGMVICSFSNREVGCDVEKRSAVRENVARRFFTSQEYQAIFIKPAGEEQEKEFYRIWTIKESFLKITGRGMSMALDEFQAPLNDDSHRIQQVYYDFPIYVKEYELGNHQIAVCSPAKAFAEEMLQIVL